jgi:ABC-2 type transport system permease protein
LVQVFPSTHYVNFAQAMLYRGAGIERVWRSCAIIAAIGMVFFTVALVRFGRTVAVG